MEGLKTGEQAIAVLGSGEYSFKGSGYVRGGIFDQLRQFGDTISFRDLDFQRLDDVYAGDADVWRDGHLHHPRPYRLRSWFTLESGVAGAASDRPHQECLQQLRAPPPVARVLSDKAPAECRGAGRRRRGRATDVGEDLVPEERADRHHRARAAAAHRHPVLPGSLHPATPFPALAAPWLPAVHP